MSRFLLVCGGLLLALSGGLLGFATWTDWQHEQTAARVSIEYAAAPPPPTVAAPPEATPVAEPPVAAPAPVEPTAVPVQPTPAPTAPPVAEPTAAPAVAEAPAADGDTTTSDDQGFVSYGPATWMEIPRIKVDSRVMEVGVKGGAYEAPAWDVGHHEDSANPGEPGNSVFNGHVTTINAGRVFAHLRDLRIGDTIRIYTHTHLLDWQVDDKFDVDNDDNSFIQPTDDTRITLYTCDGQLIPLAHDYTNRLVVVGRLVDVQERAN